MSNRVVVDIDGVLANFELEFCREFGYDRRELERLEERYPSKTLRINKFVNDGFVYKRLEPIQLGLDIVKWLNKNGYYVEIVTSRPAGLDFVTMEWLKRHGVKFGSYISKRPKTGQIINMKPFCAIDDLHSVYLSLFRANIPTIVIAHPWNWIMDGCNERIANLDQFIQSFHRLYM